MLLTMVQGVWAYQDYTPSTMSTPPTEGPWKYDAVSIGYYNNSADVWTMSFNGTNHAAWENWDAIYNITYQWQDDDGVGFTMHCNSVEKSHYGVLSTYTHSESLPSYTRKVLTWDFYLLGSSSNFPQNVTLYAHTDLATLKGIEVDYTADYSNQSGSTYHVGHLSQDGNTGKQQSPLQTKTFEFDNRSGSSTQAKTWALMLTHVVTNAGGFANCHQWGSFKNNNYSWETYYYKYVTFNSNGGTGTMSQQTVENSATLTSNAFTREDYIFAGWNTEADGTGTNYANGATITATESSKGPVTLYALWTPKSYVTWDATDEEKNNWSISPVNPVAAGTAVTATYGGTRHVKSVTYRPAGTIGGKFTINSSGDKVYFSKGNLRNVSGTWSFFDHQYDFYNAYSADAWDKFGWSTSSTTYGMSTSTTFSDYSGDFVDWGTVPGIGEGWKTLSKDEWVYLFNTRSDAANKYGHATVNGVYGIIILPDAFVDPNKNKGSNAFVGSTTPKAWNANVYTAENWALMEAAGAVFLPAAGNRGGTSVGSVDNGYYWSSSAYVGYLAYSVSFYSGNFRADNFSSRSYGQSVRLVRDVAE